MRILVGKTFGLGNAVLSIPMIKALATIGDVDVLVGTTSDDFGAADVFESVRQIKDIHYGAVPLDVEYDVAVMAIPFDGRWQEGTHFRAKRVLDGRKRPGNIERLGFDMWEKHEVLYQMENAYELGYEGLAPASDFFPRRRNDRDLVYLGLGFKRDPGGFGRTKNWGLSNFVEFIEEVVRLRPKTRFVSTGNFNDRIEMGIPLERQFRPDVFSFTEIRLPESFEILSKAGFYFGNDTGMMHVAASMKIPCFGMFLSDHLVRKNHPWRTVWQAEFLTQKPHLVAEEFAAFTELI